ncbi:MAG: KamA family radical SAM protein, partial [Gammaproteobacteria bacterium]|nr:KamA family radical SAM protein [Gammaproteobacteria bacterium]
VPGIVHRYPDRVLLLPVRVCPVYCRFCFRRETIGSNEPEVLGDAALNTALGYIRDNTAVWEVILSGGDPFILSPRRLQHIVAELNSMDHVKVIRVHTRVPVVDPSRISDELITVFAESHKPVYVVLHTNHVRELTQPALDACKKLAAAGISLLSQSVLLRGVNDDAATLEALFRELVANGIKPYYLHHADRAPGTAHFRTSITRGQQLMRELRGRLSGLCLPEYVLDIPGGHGKTPLEADWVHRDTAGLKVMDYQGARHDYDEENE